MKAVVSLSGGMDSSTVLARAIAEGRDVSAVSFAYESKHNRWEYEGAVAVAHHYGVSHRTVNLSAVMRGFKSDLLLSGGLVPEGHYEEESMRATVVPARNIIFISVLTGIAWSEGAGEIWLGVHQGDHYIYPDCRPTFIASMQEAIAYGTDKDIKLITPFLTDNKVGILREGLRLKVPYHLTRTCYSENPTACGKCGSCCERREAFAGVGVKDPILYAYTGPLPSKPKGKP
jgi:7-cyano-7-deazaguanine synthase